MAATFYFPPFPETGVDHYNVHKGTTAGLPPVTTYAKIGEVAQGAGPLLSFTDNTGTTTTLYKIASARANQVELLLSPAFKLEDLVDRVRLFGRALDSAGRPLPLIKAEVALDIPQAVRHGNILKRSSSAYAQDDGLWFIDLVPNAELIPAGSKYLVQLDNNRGGKTWPVVVPTGATLVCLSSLVTFV